MRSYNLRKRIVVTGGGFPKPHVSLDDGLQRAIDTSQVREGT